MATSTTDPDASTPQDPRPGDTASAVPESRRVAIDLRLAQAGYPTPGFDDSDTGRLMRPILARERELNRRLSERLCAADGRIQSWLDDYLADTGVTPGLPRRTLILDEPGLAR